MFYNIVLGKLDGKYVARVKEWPEIVAEEDSRDEAISSVKTKLTDYLANNMEVIQIDIPTPASNTKAWLKTFGWFKDDPTFDNLQAEIASYRQEIAEQDNINKQ